MKKLVVLFLAIALIPSIQSCKKKETPKPSAEELITKDDWTHIKNEIYDANGNLINTDTRNNKMVFSPSGDYYYYNISGNISEYGTWALLDDDTKIQMTDHGGQSRTFDIEKLGETEFNISFSDNTGKIILYFKR